MAIFQKIEGKIKLIRQGSFLSEKELQYLVENNLEEIFNCRFVATEFPTGSVHLGRIDTLALSEEKNPVIIEYKVVESSDLINQSLFYMSWIQDHHGDYEIAAKNKLGSTTEIDWSDIRVICIAPGYKKYDLHAVQMIGSNVELWEYKIYENGTFALDEVFKKTTSYAQGLIAGKTGKNQTMIEAGRKAAATRATGVYSIEEHWKKGNTNIVEMAKELRDYILGISDSIEENPKKNYIGYKITQIFVCLELRKNTLLLYLKINPDEIQPLPPNARDMRKIGHFGTGSLEYQIKSKDDVEEAKKYIIMAYKNIGG